MYNKLDEVTYSKFESLYKYPTNTSPLYPITELRSDQGTEFHNTLWTTKWNGLGIKHPQLPPYSSEKNGLAGKLIHIIKTKANSLLIPTNTIHLNVLYGYAISHATYLHNHIPATKQSESLYELLHGVLPTLDFLLKFGSDAVYKLPVGSYSKSDTAMSVTKIIIFNQGTDRNSYYVMTKDDLTFKSYLFTVLTPIGTFHYIRSMTASLDVSSRALESHFALQRREPTSKSSHKRPVIQHLRVTVTLMEKIVHGGFYQFLI